MSRPAIAGNSGTGILLLVWLLVVAAGAAGAAPLPDEGVEETEEAPSVLPLEGRWSIDATVLFVGGMPQLGTGGPGKATLCVTNSGRTIRTRFAAKELGLVVFRADSSCRIKNLTSEVEHEALLNFAESVRQGSPERLLATLMIANWEKELEESFSACYERSKAVGERPEKMGDEVEWKLAVVAPDKLISETSASGMWQTQLWTLEQADPSRCMPSD